MTALPHRHHVALVKAVAVARGAAASCPDTTALARVLYADWYTRLSTPKPDGWHAGVPFVTRLRQALSHAARGRGVFTMAEVIARETLIPSSGYWAVRGTAPGPAPPMRRVYWNVVQDGAPGLVHDLVASLPAPVWWHCKVPLCAEDYQRPDAVVLYLDADAWPRLEPLVAALAAAHRSTLHPDLPPLTARIDEGVATVRDPGVPGESYGLTLCRRIAEGLRARPAAPDPVRGLAQQLFPPRTSVGRRRSRRRPDG